GQSDLEPGAVLSATHTTLADAVVIHSAALDLTHATAASVTGQGWTGLDVFDSWVQTNVQLTAASNDHPNPSVTMVVTNSSIGNDLVAASPGAAGVTGSVIGGQFDLLGFGSLDVESTRVMQSMFLTQLGRTTLCGVQVAHNLQIAGEQAGATLSVGPQTSGCASQVTVGGNVTVVGNTGAVILGHLTIKGNLACSGNATAPVLANVTVRGTRSGQCA
ncbi:MAG: hypothetical protein JWO63_3242, partial [Frankiales bacterium]|nr:hypothetical protein [Frankiales bacterium]